MIYIFIYIENIHTLIWKPCTHTFSPAVISKMFKIRAVEAEKSTFRRELSFQRSECTAGFTVATFLCVVF
jgi:hypothetical protein